MAIGTAGYTAMLVRAWRWSAHGVTPDAGRRCWSPAPPAASARSPSRCSRRPAGASSPPPAAADEADYLKGLGAAEIIDRAELSAPGKPLGKERWAGGGRRGRRHTLANVLAQTRYGGAVAACGLAQGMDLPATVAPFILRGVTLLGIDSVTHPAKKRREAWARLARDLDLGKLAAMTSKVRLEEVGRLGDDILAGKVRGRTVVEVG